MKRKKHSEEGTWPLWQVRIPRAGVEYCLFVKAPDDPKEALGQILAILKNLKNFFVEEDLAWYDDPPYSTNDGVGDSSGKLSAHKTKIRLIA